jgi:glycerol dehydrogenase
MKSDDDTIEGERRMNGVHFVQGTPNAYVQSPGILNHAGEWIDKFGKSIFIVTGNKSWASCEDRIMPSLEAAGIRVEVQKYRGECSYEEVDRLKAFVPAHIDLICGVGGGKVLDTAKNLAQTMNRPFVAIPTIAATCAAVANFPVMYSEQGVYVDFPVYVRGTILCLVDTEVIAAAPVRYLKAGIADTLAKWIEAPQSAIGKPHNLPTVGGLAAARICYDTSIEHSEQAIRDAEQGMASEALQKIIDAIILFSGMVGGLGEDNCRSAAAHAVHNGLTTIPDTHHAYHGEKVAYGILVQLVMENRPQAYIQEILDFFARIGLPYRLAHLGIDRELSDEEYIRIAERSVSPKGTMSHMPFPVTTDFVIESIKKVESGL